MGQLLVNLVATGGYRWHKSWRILLVTNLIQHTYKPRGQGLPNHLKSHLLWYSGTNTCFLLWWLSRGPLASKTHVLTGKTHVWPASNMAMIVYDSFMAPLETYLKEVWSILGSSIECWGKHQLPKVLSGTGRWWQRQTGSPWGAHSHGFHGSCWKDWRYWKLGTPICSFFLKKKVFRPSNSPVVFVSRHLCPFLEILEW